MARKIDFSTRFKTNPLNRLVPPLIILSFIVAVGLLGYTQLEKWSLADALYMIVITLSTVGFREVRVLSGDGRLITMFVILGGVTTAIYAAGQAVEIILEGELFGYRGRKRMENKIKEIKNHYIICGFGRVGHQVADEFENAKIPYVVIDTKTETAAELEAKGIPYILGDVTSDKNLEEVGIKRAKGLIACADSDVANVYVTLSARALNHDLYIVGRASVRDTEEKLKMAGANRVLSPYFIAGRRMAALATRPVSSDFLDMVMHGEHLEFSLREILVPPDSHLLNTSLSDAQIRQKSGATILAIRKVDGGFNLQPQAASKIELGDIMVAIGTQEQLDLLEKMVK
jgi:voltage-gated potassium channel